MLLSNTLLAHTPGPWERPLLKLALDAFQNAPESAAHDSAQTMSGIWEAVDLVDLAAAFEHCRRLTARHSRSFYLASLLLPTEKRRAMHALYAFCRVADDLIDRPGPNPQAALAGWRLRTVSASPDLSDPVALAWTSTRLRYGIPTSLAEQLLDGVALDLQPVRIQTFEQLAAYAYGVASTVGLMSMHITGFRGPQAIPYAIKLGVALQITNNLRDVGEDLRMGRVYLPAEELLRFGLSEEDLAAGVVDDRWRRFMRFQIERNRRLYAEAWPGIALLDPDGRLAVAAAADFYAAILDDIEEHDFDVFTRRAHLTAWEKLRRLPPLWRRLRREQASPRGEDRLGRGSSPA